MMRKLAACCLLAVFALALPGGGHKAEAAGNKIRIATLAPRGSELDKYFKRINKGLKDATGGAWSIQFYPSGVAGDEKDVIRKMRVGQMDASIITTTGLSQIVREVAVLDAPGVIRGYKQLERVRSQMKGEWEATFDKKGFKLLSWAEGGRYRWFSKKPITKPSDVKGMRPWLWPESHVLKEIYKTIGANPVPLGVPEVYGGLQTGMIDTIVATGIAAVGLQWHSNLGYVTKESTGILNLAMVMTNEKWAGVPKQVQDYLQTQVQHFVEKEAEGTRQSDDKAIKKLLKRSYKLTSFSAAGKKEFDDMSAKVRKRLTGRIYPKALLDKVQSLAK